MSADTAPFYVALLHEDMENKKGEIVTTSITPIDVHDISRSSKTYGVKNVFIAHPSPALRKLTGTLKAHWDEGFGKRYNPNRKEALDHVRVVSNLDEVLHHIDLEHGKLPTVIATSAKAGEGRISFQDLRKKLSESSDPFLLLLGTGWGMSQSLLERANLFLEPINGPTEYNHLSVRSACAIMLDRLFA